MANEIIYDLAIAGGGLAGLSLSIQVARKGYKVILLEKEEYPFRRVCGEYISYESWVFLQSLGVDLSSLDVSSIKKLQVSSLNGKLLEQDLPLGGFGISRFLLDATLAANAVSAGVVLVEHAKVSSIDHINDEFVIRTQDTVLKAKLAAACYGKRSNLDISWKRPFAKAKKNKLNNYVGAKYHVRVPYPADTIALHIFKNGYCGISKIEGDKYCLCYLTAASNLKEAGNDFNTLEQTILSENPHLNSILKECEKLWDDPVTISQISFDKKSQVEDHVLMIGDAAGMITPLCGNGMSMALHGSKIAAEEMFSFLEGKISRKEMEQQYVRRWRKLFAGRLRMGRMIQRMFSSPWLSRSLVTIGRTFPFITRMLIKKTHGKSF